MVQLHPYYKVISWQFGIVVLSAVLIALFDKTENALALAAGGLIAALANTWFTLRVSSGARIKNSVAFMLAANRGSIEKYAFAVLGFAAVFALYKPSNPIYVFWGYLIAFFVQVFAAAFISRHFKD